MATIAKFKYKSLTFDCYGTLIDGENGLLGYVQSLLQSDYINTIDEFALNLFPRTRSGKPGSRWCLQRGTRTHKHDDEMFKAAMALLEGPILHVAKSRPHDIVPTTAQGLDTVCINRSSQGTATPIKADPTWTFTTLAELIEALGR